ncbi:MAG TPA: DNA primase, partial [Magnetospirillaceae bacterium]|nr:DNA primase [Magnetospirillaceae bacterium]
MKRIQKSSMEAVLGRTDIAAVIGEFVRLQRAGSSYKGLCPFHNEKTPSFNVVPAKGLFYCFGCLKGGDVITFLREIEGLSFTEAMESLAERCGISLEYEGTDDPSGAADRASRERDSLLEIHDRLASTFRWILREHPAGRPARHYLEKRFVSLEIQEFFRLGYAPGDRGWLFRFLREKGYSTEFLASTGLFSKERPDRAFFSDRVMFPITDPRGRCVAFGGRILAGDAPKYLNSPESPIFRKQENLFALSAASSSIRESRTAVVAEGYMDALAYHQAGVKNAVAPLGTAFTDGQARLLRRYADTLIFSFDADVAGQKASEKALITAARNGLHARVLTIENGKDPAEVLETRGVEELKKFLNSTISGDDFIIRQARGSYDISTAEGKALALKSLFPYMSALDSEIRLAEFADFAAREFRSKLDRILTDFERYRAGGGRAEGYSETPAAPLRPTPDLAFLTAAALNPGLFALVRASVGTADLEDEASRDLFLALEECFRNDETNLEALLARIHDSGIRAFLMEKATSGEYSIQAERLVRDGIHAVSERSLDKRRAGLVRRIAELDG